MFKNLLKITFFGLFSAMIFQPSGFCQDQYYIRTAKARNTKVENTNNVSTRRFVNLEQFKVQDAQPAIDTVKLSDTENQTAPQQINPMPQRVNPMPQVTRPNSSSLLLQASVKPGIQPQLMGRAISRRQFNYAFTNQAQFQDTFCDQLHLVAWRTPNFAHHTLYFEEPNLERYGISKGHLQPVYSACHFFGRVATLPYSLVKTRPGCCATTLGNDRPGNCTPACKQQLIIERKGFAAEVLVIGALLAAM